MPVRRQLDRLRRRLEERLDQGWALLTHRLSLHGHDAEWSGEPRFALVTVNYSTTRLLKLMLLTLAEQHRCSRLLRQLVIVDNGSRDGGTGFLRLLARRCEMVLLVENRLFLNHARGMRSGFAALARSEASLPPSQRANIVLSVDPDVLFLRADTLSALGEIFGSEGAAVAGELRHGIYPYPEAQASFLAVRRDLLGRADIAPWVNHGAPAYWLQRSAWRAGLGVVDFASYRDGYALHRGRSAVVAAATHAPWSSYASLPEQVPHYMDVHGGAEAWAEAERRWAPLLDAGDALIVAHLAARFSPTSA